MSLARLADRVHGRIQRSAARHLSKRAFRISAHEPLISFTFDDFPRSALHTGGSILTRYGARGTYFASFGLMGTTAPTGPIFVPEDLELLVQQRHELGCHTYAHNDSWSTRPGEFERSVMQNREALGRMLAGASFKTLAYPISPPRPATKRAMARYFACCRGGGRRINSGTVDLAHLSAFFMEQFRDTPGALERVIDQNLDTRGWLIFATHDVCDTPTPYGCTPEFFESVVRHAIHSGARVLPVIEALESLGGSSTEQVGRAD
jgi:peptidoglycan/xylan/chitin deacetylase (PgdA/CDA1 family)